MHYIHVCVYLQSPELDVSVSELSVLPETSDAVGSNRDQEPDKENMVMVSPTVY